MAWVDWPVQNQPPVQFPVGFVRPSAGKIHHKWIMLHKYQPLELNFSHMQTHFKTSAAESFWKQGGKREMSFCHNIWYPFPVTYRRILTHLQQTTFLKTLWQKEKLLKKSNISYCHNVFTFFSNYTFNYRDFPYYWVDAFKVVCCRFVVCGKGLKSSGADSLCVRMSK